MPISIKAFFVLCLAIAAWIAFWPIYHQLYPAAHHLTLMAQLPAHLRPMVEKADLMAVAFKVGQAVVLVLLACAIAIGRVAWARWILVVLVAIRYIAPAYPTLLAAGLPFNHRWEIYNQAWWSSPWDFLWLGIWLVVLILPFLPNARRWFKKAA